MSPQENTNAGARVLNLQEGKRAIKRCVKRNRPAFIWGPPGIGKSDLVSQIAEDIGGVMIDMRMALMEPTDLRGIPYFDSVSQTMKWAPPADLPKADVVSDKPVILFLDELNSAPQATQAAAYQLVLNGRIGEYVLPPNVSIVAAGNRDTDSGVTYRMPAPLANRFVHIELKADFKSWHLWAFENKVHPQVVGYLERFPNHLYDFDPKANERSFATPRSWVFVSELVQDSEDGEDDLSEIELKDLVAGTVGQGKAHEFMVFRKYAHSLPKATDILSGEVTKLSDSLTKDSISAHYSLVLAMVYELAAIWDEEKSAGATIPSDEWDKSCNYFLRFMLDNFEAEITVMGAKHAVDSKLVLSPGKMESFSQFHKQFGKYIVKAAAKPQ
jgi:hypothetical protein